MRIRLVISETFTTEERRIINAYYGKEGLATRKTIDQLIRMHGDPSYAGGNNPTWLDIFQEGRDNMEETDTDT